MNPEKFSREEIEQRITALLLGELPSEEAALLRWTISQDAELAKLHDRLKQTIDFTREAVTTPAEPTATPMAPLKLSGERREKLLVHFKLAPPRAVTPEEMGVKRFKISRVIEVLAVVAVLAVLAAMLLPSLAAAKRKAQRINAVNQMKMAQLQAEMDREDRPAPAAPMTPPAVATASPQPAPSAEIVLPKDEKALTDSNGGVISANVVGYSTIPSAGQTLAINKAIPAQYANSTDVSGSLHNLDVASLEPQTKQAPTLGAINGNGSLTASDSWQNGKLGFDDGVKSLDEIQPPSQSEPKTVGQGGRVNYNIGAEDKVHDVSKTEAPISSELSADRRLRSKYVTRLPGIAALTPAEPPTLAPTVAPPVSGQLGELDSNSPMQIYNGTTSGSIQNNLGDTTVSGGLTLNKQNTFAGEPTINGGTLQSDATKIETGTLAYSGVTKDDVDGLRFGLQTNAVALNRDGGESGGGGGGGGGGGNSAGNGGLIRSQLGVVNSAPTPSAMTPTRINPSTGLPNKQEKLSDEDRPLAKPSLPAPIPQPEFLTHENAFSTFSLNVSDVSFKLAAASLQNGQLPDAASIRSEEFINAFDYRDPEAKAGSPVAFASERARDPFAHNRDFLRFSIKTAAQGREANRPLNIVLLLDNSGSMERADRVQIIREALRVLAAQLHSQDIISVITFARTPRLWADGISGDKAGETLDKVGGITPDGGTNLEEAMKLAYQTALRHYLANGANRVVLLTDGAANLGNVNPDALKQKVESFRKQGIALDCFGIGWEGYNDDLLEELSSNGDGRYGFLNTPEEAATGFAAQLAGALKVAAQDVKVQVEFNPQRVTSWRQIGYAKHQLTKQQFRDNSVAAGEIAAQEAGNALDTIEVNPNGEGSIATVRVRYKIPGTSDYREQSWDVPYTGSAVALEKSSAAMRLAATAGEFSEWLATSPFAQDVTPDELLNELNGVPQIYGADKRPKQLEWMIRQAKSISGK